MTDPNKNWAAMQKAKQAVLAHPLCGRFEDNGQAYLVMYPAGDFPVEGVGAIYMQLGKRRALERMLEVMERHWRESYP